MNLRSPGDEIEKGLIVEIVMTFIVVSIIDPSEEKWCTLHCILTKKNWCMLHLITVIPHYLAPVMPPNSLLATESIVYSFSRTRFLDLFRVMENLLDQFPLAWKLIKLSPRQELKAIAGNPLLLVHIDHFEIHYKPMYDLTAEFQTTDLNVYVTLSMLLRFLAKINFRLGHPLVLLPQKYYSKLYDEDDVPIRMKSQNTDLFYSETHRHV